jgi:hypothetical protein
MSTPSSKEAPLLIFCLVWPIASVYLYLFAFRGWIPHDEGLLAQTATRVLDGEIPHQDFDEVYVGGLTYLHALAFKLLGTKLASLRVLLLVSAIASVPAYFLLALRATRPVVAGLFALLCVAWTVPNYFASLPSWYNLFLAAYGTLAMLRFIETNLKRWIFAAGLCAGCSILIKVVGLYFAAAVLLYLIFHEQSASKAAATDSPSSTRSTAYAAFTSVLLLILVCLLLLLIASRLTVTDLVLFILPGSALAVFLYLNERRAGHGAFKARFLSLARVTTPFLIGVILPLGLFISYYLLQGDPCKLFEGVFVLPAKRFVYASLQLPPPHHMIAAIPYAIVLSYPLARPIHWRLPLTVILVCLLAVLLLTAGARDVYQAIWGSIRPLVASVALAGCFALLKARPPARSSEARPVFLAIAVASMTSLVQFPYSLGIYFCYIAPMVALAVLYLISSQPAAPRRVHAAFGLFYLLFAILWLNNAHVSGFGIVHVRVPQDTTLELERGGISVSKEHARIYKELVRKIRRHTPSGSYIYAAPDCPEVYFLSGMKNPTRTIYDFFDDDHDRKRRILSLLRRRQVRVIVLNPTPEFSEPISPSLLETLSSEYPRAERVGSFVVRW